MSSQEVPPALNRERQAELKAAVQELPSQAGIDLSNWNWKAVRRLVEERFGLTLSRSGCLNYLHRLGFVLKRPKKRLVKADPVRREGFVREYIALTAAARRTGAKIFFADEAHFRADADLRAKWVLKGEPALVDSTSPRKASYYSAVCLETGEVELLELEGNRTPPGCLLSVARPVDGDLGQFPSSTTRCEPTWQPALGEPAHL